MNEFLKGLAGEENRDLLDKTYTPFLFFVFKGVTLKGWELLQLALILGGEMDDNPPKNKTNLTILNQVFTLLKEMDEKRPIYTYYNFVSPILAFSLMYYLTIRNTKLKESNCTQGGVNPLSIEGKVDFVTYLKGYTLYILYIMNNFPTVSNDPRHELKIHYNSGCPDEFVWFSAQTISASMCLFLITNTPVTNKPMEELRLKTDEILLECRKKALFNKHRTFNSVTHWYLIAPAVWKYIGKISLVCFFDKWSNFMLDSLSDISINLLKENPSFCSGSLVFMRERINKFKNIRLDLNAENEKDLNEADALIIKIEKYLNELSRKDLNIVNMHLLDSKPNKRALVGLEPLTEEQKNSLDLIKEILKHDNNFYAKLYLLGFYGSEKIEKTFK